MKKNVLALFFTLLFSAAAYSASLYILYDPACMDRLEYVALNGDDQSEYVAYHVNTNPGVKIVLEVGAESTTPQDFPPAQVIKCNNAVFDEKLVNAINSNIEKAFMVIKKGNNRYFISPISFAARYIRSDGHILYDSPKYRFQFDTKFGTIGENIAYKNPNTEVHFEGMLENECSGTLLFQQKAEFAGNPHTNIELIPEVGIVEERSGINAADALRNVLRLEKVNGRKLSRYLRQICKGIDEPEEPESLVAAGQPAEEFVAVGSSPEVITAKGGATEVKAPAAATSDVSAETHTVKKGETLYRLSKKYNVSVEQLKNWNNKGNSNTIFVGENLRVSPTQQQKGSATPQEGQIQTLGGPIGYEAAATPTPAATTPAAAPATLTSRGGGGGGGGVEYHIVRPGETVASIAMRYGYTEQRFRAFNNLGSNEVAKIGQPLKTSDCECPPTQPSPAAQSTAPAPTGYSSTQPRISTRYYNQGIPARQQDATGGLVEKSGATAPGPDESFNEENLSQRTIYSGQEYNYRNTPLFLDRPSSPPEAAALTPPAPQAAAPTPTQGREYSPQGDFYSITANRIESSSPDDKGLTSKGIISGSFSSRAPAGSGAVQEFNSSPAPADKARSFYVVQEGDTLFRIARMYGMTVEQLRAINNLGAREVIIPYQKIYLN